MELCECKYRIPVNQSLPENQGVEKAMDQIGTQKISHDVVVPNLVSGTMKQEFKIGLCQILTTYDIGPVECRQPNCNETNCPDIKDLIEA